MSKNKFLKMNLSLWTTMTYEDMVQLIAYIKKNPMGWIFELEVNGKVDV